MASTLITFVVILLAGVYLYYIGTVLVQALKISILRTNSELKMKLEHHEEALRQRKALFDSGVVALPEGKFVEKPEKPADIITVEMSLASSAFEKGRDEIEHALGKTAGVRSFVILEDKVFLDIAAGKESFTSIINSIKLAGIDVASAKVLSAEKEKKKAEKSFEELELEEF